MDGQALSRGKSKYLALYGQVRRDIIEGVYPAGSRLPSKRNLAQEMNVSVITVEHAYELLVDEGYAMAEEKRGYFVIYDPGTVFPVAETVTQVHGAGNDEITVNENKTAISFTDSRPETGGYGAGAESSAAIPSFPASLYVRMCRKIMSYNREEIFEKAPGFGVEKLRRAIASYLRRSRGIEAEPERIIVGAGAEYLYGMIVKALGRHISYGIENPSYQNIKKVYETEGVKLTMLPLGKDGIDSSKLWKADISALHITPYRSFPTGVTASASKKHEYIRWCNERNAVIIEDDFESEFSPSRKPEETLFALSNGKNIIYVNTFTRTIGSFIRVAYMVVPRELLGLFQERLGFYSCPVPTPEQYILAEVIENGDFERHLNRVRRSRR